MRTDVALQTLKALRTDVALQTLKALRTDITLEACEFEHAPLFPYVTGEMTPITHPNMSRWVIDMNGEVVSTFPGTQNSEFLQGDNQIWRLNSIRDDAVAARNEDESLRQLRRIARSVGLQLVDERSEADASGSSGHLLEHFAACIAHRC